MSRQLKRLPEEVSDDDDDIVTEQIELAPDDPLRNYLPTSFGVQEHYQDPEELYELARRIPKKEKKPKDEDEDDDDSDDDSDDDDDEYPVSHSITFKPHSKPVSSISVDPSGTRFASASHDYLLKLYDFHSMSRDHLYGFKSFEPFEAHHIHNISFSPLDNGQNLLVIPATPQAKLYSRDGDELVEFVKGDMYLRDMHNTKGHVAEITSGVWSPTDKNVFATASADSTIRLWDVNNKRQHKEIMVHKSKTSKGGRSRMCSLAWTGGEQGGKSMLASVALDGSLVIYPGDGPYTRPAMEVRSAHTPETWTGAVTFSPDGRLIVTRGDDQCIKLWDTRKLKTPVSTRTDFPTPIHPEANLIFSPSSSNIITGDSTGALHILSSATLTSEETHSLSTSPIISVTWHQGLNQLLAGTANGSIHLLFNPGISHKGALHILTNPLRKRHIDDDMANITDTLGMSADAIMAPSEAGQRKRKMDERKPKVPPQTPWGKNAPDPEHVSRTHALAGMRDEDPREALLKYAEKAEKEPLFTGVYGKNQPKPVFARMEDFEDDEEEEKTKKRRY